MIKTMFLEILNVDAHNQILLINCVTDSKSLHDAVYSTKTLTEKRLKIELCEIQESLEKQVKISCLIASQRRGPRKVVWYSEWKNKATELKKRISNSFSLI